MKKLETIHKHKLLGNLHIVIQIINPASEDSKWADPVDYIRFRYEGVRYEVYFWHNPKTNRREISFALAGKMHLPDNYREIDPFPTLLTFAQSPNCDRLISLYIRRIMSFLKLSHQALQGMP